MALSILNPFGFLHGPVKVPHGIAPATTGNVKSVSAAGTTYTFSAAFQMTLNGQLVQFRSTDTYSISPDVLAKVQAAAAAAGSTMTSV